MVSRQELKVSGRWWCLGTGKGSLIKDNVSRDDNPVRQQIKTPVPLVIGGIAKKDAKGGPRRELVRRCGGQVRVASTTEHTEMRVGWVGSVQVEEGRPEVERLGGEAVQQVSCRVKAFDPVRGKEGRLKQH
jgi:hypothetical protein